MKILLMTHNVFAESILKSYEMIIGDDGGIRTVCLLEDNFSEFKDQANAAIDELLADGSDLLIMCDVAGGTPFNVALERKLNNKDENIEVLTGLNLPMLIEAGMALDSGDAAENVATLSVDSAKSGIKRVE